jgi:hypothetical protein
MSSVNQTNPDFSPLIPGRKYVQKFQKLATASVILVTIAAAFIIVGMLVGVIAITYIALAFYLLGMIAYVIFNHFELKKREENYKMMLVILNDTVEDPKN